MKTRGADFSGKEFNGIKVLAICGKTKHGSWVWECICHCGNIFTMTAPHVKSGKQKSCGCIKHYFTHQLSGTPEHRIWLGIKSRCKPFYKDHARYYDRGIAVCERWRKFENFLEDMGPRPSPKHTVEREDNNKGYDPSNCIWATRKVQGNNTSQNKIITYMGRSQTVSQWCDELGLVRSSVYARIARGKHPYGSILLF